MLHFAMFKTNPQTQPYRSLLLFTLIALLFFAFFHPGVVIPASVPVGLSDLSSHSATVPSLEGIVPIAEPPDEDALLDEREYGPSYEPPSDASHIHKALVMGRTSTEDVSWVDELGPE